MNILGDEALVNVLLQHDGAFKKLLSEAKYANLSQADTDAAIKRTAAWQKTTAAFDQLGTKLMTFLTGPIVDFNTAMQNSIDKTYEQGRALKAMIGPDFYDRIKKSGTSILDAFKEAFKFAFAWLEGRLNSIWKAITGHGLFAAEAAEATGLFRPGAGGSTGPGSSSLGSGPPAGSPSSGPAGASRSFRNKNPGNIKSGNIKYGDFAKTHGSTGQDAEGFAVFSDEAAGKAAQRELWNKKYANTPFESAFPKWSSSGYGPKKFGLSGSGTWAGLNETQKEKLLNDQRRFEGWSSGGTTPVASDSHASRKRLLNRGVGAGALSTTGRHIGGLINVDGTPFHFGSGGGGSQHIPYGDYPITPGTIGPWGAAHGAIGVNNNAIWDSELGRMRSGIELHPGHGSLFTAGCIAIAKGEWPQFKAKVKELYRLGEGADLHVSPSGASITPHHRLHSMLNSQVGAHLAANISDHSRSGNNHHNSSNSEVHVGAVHVIAQDIKPDIQRTSYAMQGNYSLA